MVETINTIKTLLQKNFLLTLEDGRMIKFHFKPGYIFHLLGLHYLVDMPHISNAKNKAGIIKQLLREPKLSQQIQQSTHFGKIQERVYTFNKIVEMLLTDKCEIIVDFDKSQLPSCKLISKFLLYKTDDYCTYYILGFAPIGNETYYPETYIVENSKYYISGQKLLTCKISHETHRPKGKRDHKQKEYRQQE